MSAPRVPKLFLVRRAVCLMTDGQYPSARMIEEALRSVDEEVFEITELGTANPDAPCIDFVITEELRPEVESVGQALAFIEQVKMQAPQAGQEAEAAPEKPAEPLDARSEYRAGLLSQPHDLKWIEGEWYFFSGRRAYVHKLQGDNAICVHETSGARMVLDARDLVDSAEHLANYKPQDSMVLWRKGIPRPEQIAWLNALGGIWIRKLPDSMGNALQRIRFSISQHFGIADDVYGDKPSSARQKPPHLFADGDDDGPPLDITMAGEHSMKRWEESEYRPSLGGVPIEWPPE